MFQFAAMTKQDTRLEDMGRNLRKAKRAEKTTRIKFLQGFSASGMNRGDIVALDPIVAAHYIKMEISGKKVAKFESGIDPFKAIKEAEAKKKSELLASTDLADVAQDRSVKGDKTLKR